MVADSSTNGDQEKNHVVLCADPRFALGAWVAIWSAYVKSGRKLAFSLLTTGAESAPIRKMQTLAKRDGIPLAIVQVDMRFLETLPTAGRHATHAYIRLLAPGVLSHLDRFLYLDSDILVRSSLLPLFADLPDDKIAAAIRDYGYSDIEHGLKQTYEALGLNPAAPYVNTGIMMINARLWRNEDITTQAVNYLQRYRKTIVHPDQDALNAVLSGKLNEVDLAWNVQIGAIRFYDRMGWPEGKAFLKRRRAQLLSEPKIVHFIGPSKPWNDGLLIPHVRGYQKVIFQSGWIPRWGRGPWLCSWLWSAGRKALQRRRTPLKSSKPVLQSSSK